MGAENRIDLDPPARGGVGSSRVGYRSLIVGLVGAVGLASGLAIGMRSGSASTAAASPSQVSREVLFEVSTFPVSGAAGWGDGAGHHFTVPSGTFSIVAPVVRAWIMVDDPGVRCTLTIDGAVVDMQTATDDKPGICQWVSVSPSPRPGY